MEKIKEILKVMVNETVVTAIVSILLGVFGKEFWDFWKNRDTIKGQLDCKEEIANLKKECAEKITEITKKLNSEANERKQTNSIVLMLLNVLEDEYGDKIKFKNAMTQVKKRITPSNE